MAGGSGNPTTSADLESEKAHQAMQHGVHGSDNYPTTTALACMCIEVLPHMQATLDCFIVVSHPSWDSPTSHTK